MRHLDLFSGIGGFALAASWVWKDEYINVGHSEIEPYADKVYHRHFPESPCLGDITKIRWEEGQADLITGGFPCQPHSVAGKRKGSADERDLWSECVRALCGVRPRYALFENVPNLFRSDNGRFFNRVLTDIHESGYDAEWQTLSACSIGATHTRERLWIVVYPRVEHGDCREVFSQDSRDYYERRKEEKKWGDNREFATLASEPLPRMESGRQGFYAFPSVSRMAYGLPNQLDIIRGIGNSIVPQVAQVIMEAIKAQDTP